MIVASIQAASPGYCLGQAELGTLNTFPRSASWDCCENVTQSLCFLTEQKDHMCINVRTLLSVVNRTYLSPTDCGTGDEFIRPVLNGNSTKFIQMQRREERDFLYVGNPALIYTSVLLSDYCPRFSLVPLAAPDILDKLCKYIISFSGGLAVLNVIPSLLLDGQHMIKVLLGKNKYFSFSLLCESVPKMNHFKGN